MNDTKTRKRNKLIALALAGLLGATTLSGPVLEHAFAENLTNQVTGQHAPTEGFADIVEKVMPAVVAVRIEGRQTVQLSRDSLPDIPGLPKDSPFYEFFRNLPRMPEGRQPEHSVGLGSGFIISEDGYVVTNNHVVDKADKVVVTTNDGKDHTAKVIGTDPKTDLAVLKIEGDKTFSYVQFAKSEGRVGDWVVAVGNPFGLGGTVTTGIISARGREIGAGPYDDFLQIDAPINRGNSGGPTFNLNGEVVGVNTAIYSPSGGSVGIGFAIPASIASRVVDSLIEKGHVTRGWLGVAIQPVSEDIAESLGAKSTDGALIAEVNDGSPAAKGGLQVGDLVLGVNDQAIKSPRELSRAVAGIEPGTDAKLRVLRNGEEQTITVDIGKMPEDQQVASVSPDAPSGESSLSRFGFSVAPADDGTGVTIVDVDPNGAAAEKGLQEGDRIVEVGGKQVKSPAELRSALDTAGKDRKSVLLLVRRGDNQLFVALPLSRS
ncbi:DegQ family serine endoprotease [Rhodoligotrophos defluvii]|uniref:DegQ family serine endoprotease n=1 Tax=Rhodoligotrophos defluvii TaxID=2561934 RepID=UPI00148568CD|nr:DegQ family serine endoprotease [Rhodoligotrophos defluvii]